jgi:outer membrane protein assembly factor BamE
MRRTLSLLLAAVVAPIVAGCNPLNVFSVYRMEVQQGNYVSQEMVSQLRAGMTRDQVRFVMGTPLVTDVFRPDRWDYIYMRRRANAREFEERRLTVFFENDRLARVEGDVVAGDVPEDLQVAK